MLGTTCDRKTALYTKVHRAVKTGGVSRELKGVCLPSEVGS